MRHPRFCYHFITLFPDTITVWMTTSILGRALEKNLFEIKVYQLRDFAEDKHRTVDDVAYGGGGGMVLKLEPLVRAVEQIKQNLGEVASKVIYFSPSGETLSESLLQRCLQSNWPRDLILVCGHYEGVDQRFIDGWVDNQISLGPFVLTGGELPALAFADALSRKIEGTLGARSGANLEESFSLTDEQGRALVEYPQFTRPASFRGIAVPDVLLSGDHRRIREWRLRESHHRTGQLPRA